MATSKINKKLTIGQLKIELEKKRDNEKLLAEKGMGLPESIIKRINEILNIIDENTKEDKAKLEQEIYVNVAAVSIIPKDVKGLVDQFNKMKSDVVRSSLGHLRKMKLLRKRLFLHKMLLHKTLLHKMLFQRCKIKIRQQLILQEILLMKYQWLRHRQRILAWHHRLLPE